MKKKKEEVASNKSERFNELVSKNKVLILIIAISVVVIATASSYAFFAGVVKNQGSVYNTVVETGRMSLLFTDGEVIGTTSNMLPGQSIKKRFKVKNNGTVNTTYTLYLVDVVNSFNPKSDLVYSIAAINNTNGYSTPADTTVVAPANNAAIIENQSITPNEEHEYELTLTFKETGENQDDNKGKTFSGKLSLNDPSAPSVASEIEYYNAYSETCGNDHSVECAIDEIADKLGVNFDTPQSGN